MAARTTPEPAPVASTVAEDTTGTVDPAHLADLTRAWGTYRAVADLIVDGAVAVRAGGAVPSTHPYLRDSEVRGPGWVSQGAVELTGVYDAPEDLAGLTPPTGFPGGFPGV